MCTDSLIVEEVRQRRRNSSRQYGDDLDRYAAHLREIEAALASRVVDQITVIQSSHQPVPPGQPASG